MIWREFECYSIKPINQKTMKANVNFDTVLVNVLSVFILVIIVATGYTQYIKIKLSLKSKRVPVPIKAKQAKARF